MSSLDMWALALGTSILPADSLLGPMVSAPWEALRPLGFRLGMEWQGLGTPKPAEAQPWAAAGAGDAGAVRSRAAAEPWSRGAGSLGGGGAQMDGGPEELSELLRPTGLSDGRETYTEHGIERGVPDIWSPASEAMRSCSTLRQLLGSSGKSGSLSFLVLSEPGCGCWRPPKRVGDRTPLGLGPATQRRC